MKLKRVAGDFARAVSDAAKGAYEELRTPPPVHLPTPPTGPCHELVTWETVLRELLRIRDAKAPWMYGGPAYTTGWNSAFEHIVQEFDKFAAAQRDKPAAEAIPAGCVYVNGAHGPEAHWHPPISREPPDPWQHDGMGYPMPVEFDPEDDE